MKERNELRVYFSVWIWIAGAWECIFSASGSRAETAATKEQERQHARGNQAVQAINETNLIGRRLTTEAWRRLDLS